MADEIVYKKVTRKADKGLEGKVIAKHGKQTNQKLKPYVVLQYLLKYSDENNTKSAYDIIGYLEDCGISAERRSIYRDIEDIQSFGDGAEVLLVGTQGFVLYASGSSRREKKTNILGNRGFLNISHGYSCHNYTS